MCYWIAFKHMAVKCQDVNCKILILFCYTIVPSSVFPQVYMYGVLAGIEIVFLIPVAYFYQYNVQKWFSDRSGEIGSMRKLFTNSWHSAHFHKLPSLHALPLPTSSSPKMIPLLDHENTNTWKSKVHIQVVIVIFLYPNLEYKCAMIYDAWHQFKFAVNSELASSQLTFFKACVLVPKDSYCSESINNSRMKCFKILYQHAVEVGVGMVM